MAILEKKTLEYLLATELPSEHTIRFFDYQKFHGSQFGEPQSGYTCNGVVMIEYWIYKKWYDEFIAPTEIG